MTKKNQICERYLRMFFMQVGSSFFDFADPLGQFGIFLGQRFASLLRAVQRLVQPGDFGFRQCSIMLQRRRQPIGRFEAVLHRADGLVHGSQFVLVQLDHR